MTEKDGFKEPCNSISTNIDPLSPAESISEVITFGTSVFNDISLTTPQVPVTELNKKENIKSLLFREHKRNSKEGTAYRKPSTDEDTNEDTILTAFPIDPFFDTGKYLSDIPLLTKDSGTDDTDSEDIDLRLFSDSTDPESSDFETSSSLFEFPTDIFNPLMGNLPNFDLLSSDSSSESLRGRYVRHSPLRVETKPLKTARVGDLGKERLFNTRAVEQNVSKCPDSFGLDITKYCTTTVQSALSEKLTETTHSGKTKTFTGSASDFKLKKITLETDFNEFANADCSIPPKRKQKSSTVTTKDASASTQEKESKIATFSTLGDQDICRAIQKSLEEGSLMPMLKQELKMKIQVDRLERGKPELVLGQYKPRNYTLRKDEIEKREKRLLQNRVSAQKCRRKFRERIHDLKKEIKQSMASNAKLSLEMKQLQKERETLLKQLKVHNTICLKTK